MWESYAKNGLITGHLRDRRAMESIGNKFAASIWGRLSPSRPSRASKMSKLCQKNWVTQFLRYQFLSIQDRTCFYCFSIVFLYHSPSWLQRFSKPTLVIETVLACRIRMSTVFLLWWAYCTIDCWPNDATIPQTYHMIYSSLASGEINWMVHIFYWLAEKTAPS